MRKTFGFCPLLDHTITNQGIANACLQNVPDACNTKIDSPSEPFTLSIQGLAGLFLQIAPGACNLFMEKNRIQIQEKRPNKLVIEMYNCLSSECGVLYICIWGHISKHLSF